MLISQRLTSIGPILIAVIFLSNQRHELAFAISPDQEGFVAFKEET